MRVDLFCRKPAAGPRLLLATAIIAAAICARHAAAHGVTGHGKSGSDGAPPGGEGVASTQLNPAKPAASLSSQNVGLGFLLVGLAALFSVLGSALPFLDRLIHSNRFFSGRFKEVSIAESRTFLAAMLGSSAGLLLTLALSDLMPGAAEHLREAGIFPSQHAQLVSTAVFIAGIGLVYGCKQLPSSLKTHDHGPQLADKNHAGDGGEAGHLNGKEADHLNTVGKQIVLSLALHNFPEGLTTFSAAMLSPKVGMLYGIALSLHKIPEGLMMFLPLYYASGSRVRAFAIAAASGVFAQLAGAIVALVLFRTIHPADIAAFTGFVFSGVAGLVLYIVIGGILPMGRSFDADDHYLTKSVLAGAAFFYLVHSIFAYV